MFSNTGIHFNEKYVVKIKGEKGNFFEYSILQGDNIGWFILLCKVLITWF